MLTEQPGANLTRENFITFLSQPLQPRQGWAKEITRRTLEFDYPVQGGHLVRVLHTGENILVLRRRKRGGGWVVRRAMGTWKRVSFGEAEVATVAASIVPEGMTLVASAPEA